MIWQAGSGTGQAGWNPVGVRLRKVSDRSLIAQTSQCEVANGEAMPSSGEPHVVLSECALSHVLTGLLQDEFSGLILFAAQGYAGGC